METVKVRIEIRLCNEKFVFCFRDFRVISHGMRKKLSTFRSRYSISNATHHRPSTNFIVFSPFLSLFLEIHLFHDFSAVIFVTKAACFLFLSGVILFDDLLDYDSKLNARDRPGSLVFLFHFGICLNLSLYLQIFIDVVYILIISLCITFKLVSCMTNHKKNFLVQIEQMSWSFPLKK